MNFIKNLFHRGKNPMVKSEEEIDVFDEETLFMYIFVREDMPPVIQLIQAAHATYTMGSLGNISKGAENVHFCVLGVKDENELKSVSFDLERNDFEPDNDIGYTAIACEPMKGESRKWFRKFNLLKM